MTLPVEHFPVLKGDARLPAEMFQFLQGLFVCPAPARTVGEEHIGPLRFGQGDTLEAAADIIHRIAGISRKDPAQFFQPCLPLRGIGSDQGVHGQHIHIIIVAQRGFFQNSLAQGFIIDNVIAAHKSGQIESLGGRIQGHRVFTCIIADALGRNMPVSGQDQIRPYFVADDFDIILRKDGKCLLQLFFCPDTPAGVVG